MTRSEFTQLARALIGEHSDVAFRARPGPRALLRRRDCSVVCVDLASPDTARDMREGFSALKENA